MTIAPLTPVVVPNLSTTFPITAAAGNAPSQMPSQQFLRTWQQQLQALTAAINTINTTVNALNAQEASLQTQVTALAKVLNGTTPFSGLNAAGTEVIPFLQNTNGTAIDNPAGLAAGVVSTTAVATNAITESATVDTTAPSNATSTATITVNANLTPGDYFTIGSETWTATNSAPGAFQWEIGANATQSAANFANALTAGSAVAFASPSGTTAILTTYASGVAANSTTATFTRAGPNFGATITSFSGGAANFVITTSGQYFTVYSSSITSTVNGGIMQINGKVAFTHNQTSTAIFHIQITRTSYPVGANPFTDTIAYFLPGVGGLYIDGTLYFLDDQLNGVSGSVTYQIALEVTNNSGAGYQQTTNAIQLSTLNIKR